MTSPSTSSPPSPKRRLLLKGALAVGAVGAALGGSVFWQRGVADGVVTPRGADIFRAVGRAVLADMLPKDPAQREAKLDGLLKRIQEVIGTMPPSGQKELSALLGLLANAPTRLMITGLRSSWDQASAEEVAQALENLRVHKLPTNMITYHALRDLTCIAFFSIPDNWSITGYPGPLEI